MMVEFSFAANHWRQWPISNDVCALSTRRTFFPSGLFNSGRASKSLTLVRLMFCSVWSWRRKHSSAYESTCKNDSIQSTYFTLSRQQKSSDFFQQTISFNIACLLGIESIVMRETSKQEDFRQQQRKSMFFLLRRVLLCVFLSCSPMEKIFFYYKALIFSKLFFIRVFVLGRKTHGFFFSRFLIQTLCSRGDTTKRGQILVQKLFCCLSATEKRFLRECFVNCFLLFRSDCWSRRIQKIFFGGYASLLVNRKNLSQFFSRCLSGKKFFAASLGYFLIGKLNGRKCKMIFGDE